MKNTLRHIEHIKLLDLQARLISIMAFFDSGKYELTICEMRNHSEEGMKLLLGYMEKYKWVPKNPED